MSTISRQTGGKGEWNIGASRWVAFRRKDRKLILLMFKMTLDDYFKHSKKSHWIKLECRWKNLGCKTTYDKKEDDIYPKKKGGENDYHSKR